MRNDLLVAAAILACALFIGALEKHSIPAEQAVIAGSPRPITHYTIEQSSPGIEHLQRNGFEKAPLPLTYPLVRE